MDGNARSSGARDPAGRVGVRDVARAAGVSTQTVSRVINDHPHICPETRSRVLDVMADHGYRVNNAARTLGTRTSRTLGVIASDATLYGPSVGMRPSRARRVRLIGGSLRPTRMPDTRDLSSMRLIACSRRGSMGSSFSRPMP